MRRIAPIYPREAVRQRTEGEVVVEFSVTKAGRTDNFAILESQPPGVFDQAVLQAVYHWRYCPHEHDVDPRLKVRLPFTILQKDPRKKDRPEVPESL